VKWARLGWLTLLFACGGEAPDSSDQNGLDPAIGCGDGRTCRPVTPFNGEAGIRLLTREGDGTQSLAPGQSLQLVKGSPVQRAGQHVYVGMEFDAPRAGSWGIVFEVLRPSDGVRVGGVVQRVRLCEAGRFVVDPNNRVFVDSDFSRPVIIRGEVVPFDANCDAEESPFVEEVPVEVLATVPG
jgi:hypothetical protein